MKKILVLCTGNSCRSQIAEGYLKHFTEGKVIICSAGLETHGVNPKAIEIMQEDGIDISRHTSDHIDVYKDIHFDFIITVCDHAREHCPWYPSDAVRFHHDFPDPARAEGNESEVMAEFRRVRDLIKDYCLNFIHDNLPGTET